MGKGVDWDWELRVDEAKKKTKKNKKGKQRGWDKNISEARVSHGMWATAVSSPQLDKYPSYLPYYDFWLSPSPLSLSLSLSL